MKSIIPRWVLSNYHSVWKIHRSPENELFWLEIPSQHLSHISIKFFKVPLFRNIFFQSEHSRHISFQFALFRPTSFLFALTRYISITDCSYYWQFFFCLHYLSRFIYLWTCSHFFFLTPLLKQRSAGLGKN